MNFYQELEVPSNASKEQIKKKYKELALRYHPDKNSNDKEKAKQRFTRIAQAYATLSDAQKRAAYDQKLIQDANISQQNTRNFPQYQWKNPQFDPKFDHFANMKTHPSFKHFQMPQMPQYNKSFGMFGQKLLNSQFGSFTFVMAQEVFQDVFKNLNETQQGIEYNPQRPQATRELYCQQQITQSVRHSVNNYVPLNSELFQEIVIQRNGQRVLVKKFWVTQGNKKHKEVHQSILGPA